MDEKVNHTTDLAVKTNNQLLENEQLLDHHDEQIETLLQEVYYLTLYSEPPKPVKQITPATTVHNQETADKLDKQINTTVNQHQELHSYTQFIADRSSTITDKLQHQITTLQEQQVDIEKLQ